MFSFHLTFEKQSKENYFQIEDLKIGKNYEPSQNWMRIIYCKGFQVRPITQMDQDAKNLFFFNLQNILNERHKQTFKQTKAKIKIDREKKETQKEKRYK